MFTRTHTGFCLLLLTLLLIGPAVPLRAEEGGMLVTPQRLVLDKGERTGSFILANRSAQTKRFRITIINRAMTEEGAIINADQPANGEHFADQYLRVAPRSVTVEPNQSQTVRIMSRLPGNAKDGEYRSHVLFEEVTIPPTAKTPTPSGERTQQIRVATRVSFAMPVIIRKGDLSAGITMQDPRILKDDYGYFALVDLARNGNRSTLGNVTVYAGDTLVGTLNAVGVYMSVPKRTAKVTLSVPPLPKGTHLTFKYTPIDGSTLPTNDIEMTTP